MKKFLSNIFKSAIILNLKNIEELLETDIKAKFMDLGCDDGKLTRKMADKIRTKNIYGVEIVKERVTVAKKNGVDTRSFDLNGRFKLPNDSFDVVLANQVIEHIYDSDNFISEIYRVLKPGGYAIISTENASSWCNIFASVFGWQIFSLTNFSSMKQGIGNPISLHRNESMNLSSWNHVRIYNFFGLKEYFETAGFKIQEIQGAGYFPLPSFLGKIDKRHSHFMTFKIRK